MMKNQTQDETRWLLRLFAVLIILFGIQGIYFQFQSITGVDFSMPRFFFAMGVILLLFWLGYRLWRSGSLWDIFSFLPQTPPMVLYLQCQYFRLGKHKRCGLVGAALFLIVDYLLPILLHRHKGIWFCDLIGHFWAIAHWPAVRLLEAFNPVKEDRAVSAIMLLILYSLIIGYLLGWGLSRVKQMLSNRKKTVAESLNVLYDTMPNE